MAKNEMSAHTIEINVQEMDYIASRTRILSTGGMIMENRSE